MFNFEKELKKQKKRMILNQNKFRGNLAEQMYFMGATFQGKKVTRKAHGSDYIEQKVNIFGKPVGPKKLVEVKSSSTAPLTKLQKETQKKNKGKYKVWRPNYF